MTFIEQHSGLDTLTTLPSTEPSKTEKKLMKHQSEQVNKTISQEINTLNTKEKERQKKSQTDTKNKGNLSDDLFRKNSNTPTNSYENKIQDERQQQDQKWLKGVFSQTVHDIETTGNQDTELQKTRNISLKIKSMGSFDLQSYGNRTMIDINKGQLKVATKTGQTLIFPLSLTLDKDGSTDTFLHNQKNQQKVNVIYRLANLINRGQYLSQNIKDKSADNYQPFHIEKNKYMPLVDTIEIQNGLSDFQLIKEGNIEQYAKAFGTEEKNFTKILINFLNTLHRTNYQQNNSSKGKVF